MRGYQLWAAEANKHGGVLGRKVQLKIVDDTSSPNQVVTNYQTLISRDKVDLVFGPFSTLLTAPAARVAYRYHYAFVEPAGGGPAVFAEHLGNVFFVQPAPVLKSGDAFVKYILSLPKSQAPEDRRLPVARRSVLLADRRPHARASSRRPASRRSSRRSTRRRPPT